MDTVEVKFQLTGDSKQIEAAVASFSRSLKKVSSEAKKEANEVAKVAKGVALGNLLSQGITGGIGLAVKGFTMLKNSIKEWRDAAGVQIKAEKNLTQTIKSTGGAAGLTATEIKEMAAGLQKTTNFGDEVIMQGQAMLLTFTKIGKDVFPEATEAMLNFAQKFQVEPQQAAIMIGKALNDPIRGIVAMRRVGVSFTEEQEKQIKNFMAQGKQVEAQKVILGELNTEFGGMAKAMASPFKQLQNQIGDIKEVLGLAVIQLFKAFLPMKQALVDMLQDVIPIIVPIVKQIAETIAPVVKIASGIITKIGPPLQSLLGTVFRVLAPIIKALSEASARLIPIFVRLASVVGKIIEAFQPLLVVMGDLFIQNINSIIPLVEGLLDLFVELLPAIVALVPVIVEMTKAANFFIVGPVAALVKAMRFILDAGSEVAAAVNSIFGGEETEQKAVKKVKVEFVADTTEGLPGIINPADNNNLPPPGGGEADEAAKKAAEEKRKRQDELFRREREAAIAQAQDRNALASELLRIELSFLEREKEIARKRKAEQSDLLKFDTEIAAKRREIARALRDEAKAVSSAQMDQAAIRERIGLTSSSSGEAQEMEHSLELMKTYRDLMEEAGASEKQLGGMDAALLDAEIQGIEQKYNAEIALLELEREGIQQQIAEAQARNDSAEAIRLQTSMLEKNAEIRSKGTERDREVQKKREEAEAASARRLIKNEKDAAEKRLERYEKYFGGPMRDGIKGVIEDLVAGGERATHAFSNMWSGLASTAVSAIADIVAAFIAGQLQTLAAQIGLIAPAVAAATTTAAAWAPAASMVSLATFGANSIPAIAGMSAASTAAQILAIPKFAEGGVAIGPTLALFGEKEREAALPESKVVPFLAAALGADKSGESMGRLGSVPPARRGLDVSVNFSSLRKGVSAVERSRGIPQA